MLMHHGLPRSSSHYAIYPCHSLRVAEDILVGGRDHVPGGGRHGRPK